MLVISMMKYPITVNEKSEEIEGALKEYKKVKEIDYRENFGTISSPGYMVTTTSSFSPEEKKEIESIPGVKKDLELFFQID